MYKATHEIEDLIKKVIRIINLDEKLKLDCFGSSGLSTLGLANAAGNHWFDDFPERFSIMKQEGHNLRAYFQQNSHYNEDFNTYIKSLIESLDSHWCPWCDDVAYEVREEFISHQKDINGEEIKYMAPFWKCTNEGCDTWMDSVQEDELDNYLETRVPDKSYFLKKRAKLKEIREKENQIVEV
jgi:hypothetical protein